MAKVFITGIGGFIGAHLARHARERGDEAFGVDLDPSTLWRMHEEGFRVSRADITDEVAMRRAAEGADIAIHTAALVRESGPISLFRKVNVEGAEVVGRAAREGGAHTYVHLSSVMVYGFDFPPNVREDGPLDGARNPYCQTKIESEPVVRALARDGFGVIVIRPGDVFGPGSVPWVARPIRMMLRRQAILPSAGGGVINPVYIDNLVEGIFGAIDGRAHGDTFNLSDGIAVPNLDYFRRIAALAGVPGPLAVPPAAFRAVGWAMSRGLVPKLGAEAPDAESLRYMRRRHAYSIERARERLGYTPRVSLDEGLLRTRGFAREVAAAARG